MLKHRKSFFNLKFKQNNFAEYTNAFGSLTLTLKKYIVCISWNRIQIYAQVLVWSSMEFIGNNQNPKNYLHQRQFKYKLVIRLVSRIANKTCFLHFDASNEALLVTCISLLLQWYFRSIICIAVKKQLQTSNRSASIK